MKGTSPARIGIGVPRLKCRLFNLITRGEVMEQITTVGIDLAKRVFALHGVDAAGRVVLRRTVRREQLMEAMAGLTACVVGMEAGSGAAPAIAEVSGSFNHKATVTITGSGFGNKSQAATVVW